MKQYTVGCAVSAKERTELYASLHGMGYTSMSQGIRDVLFAFARSISVQREVAHHLAQQWSKE